MKFKYGQIYAVSILATIFLQFAQCELTGKLGTDEEYDTNPSYKFEYSVSDPLTGDTKSQSETREGDTVTGYYQLLEPDGSYRTVNYIADAINGFRATVSKTEPGDYKTYQKYPATQNDYSKPTPSHAIIVTAPAPAAPAQASKDTKISQQPQPYQGAPYYIPTASYYPQPQSYYYPNPYYYPAYQQYLNAYYRTYDQQQQSQQQHNQKKWN